MLAVAVLFCFQSAIQAQKDSLVNLNYAQEAPAADGARVRMLSFGIGGLRPKAAFGKKLTGSQFQFNVSFIDQVKPAKPLFAGIELGYAHLEGLNAELPFVVDGESEDWDVTTNSQLLSLDLLARYYLPLRVSTLEFFSEFNVGGNLFFTTTAFSPPDVDEMGDTDWENTDFAMRYGVGMGCNYPVSDKIYIQARIGYTAGLSAEYFTLKKETVQIVDSTIESFELQKSTTDVLKWDIGVTFAF